MRDDVPPPTDPPSDSVSRLPPQLPLGPTAPAEWFQPAAGLALSHALPAAPAAAIPIASGVAPEAAPLAAGIAPPAAAPGIAAPPAAVAGSAPPAEEDDAEDSGPEVEDEQRGRPQGSEERRTMPRSRSGSRPRDEDAASGARDDQEDEVDLTIRLLSGARIARLSDEAKAELRQIVRKDLPQQHFCDHREDWQAEAAKFAASGAILRMPQLDEKNARAIEEALDFYCEPIPPAQAFLSGIAHRNDRPDKAGQLWDVVRACLQKGALQGAAAAGSLG